jgi:hypothetical protein
VLHEDNAAGRLCVLLRSVREDIQSGFPPKDAWRRTLGVPDPDDDPWSAPVESIWGAGVSASTALGTGIQMHTAMMGAYGILSEVYNELQSLQGKVDVDRYSSYLIVWGRAFGLSAIKENVPAEDIISQASLDVLASLADILHVQGVRSGVSDDAIVAADSLLGEVSSLINQVLSLEDLDANFRTFLLEQLSKIESAIRQFRLRGYTALDEIVGKIQGDAVRRPGRWLNFAEQSMWKRFTSVLRSVTLLRHGSQDATELAENTKKLLELF